MATSEKELVITKIEPSLFHGGTLWNCVDSEGHDVQIAIDPLNNVRVRRAQEAGVSHGTWTTLYEESLDNLPDVETYGDLQKHLESVGVAFSKGIVLSVRLAL